MIICYHFQKQVYPGAGGGACKNSPAERSQQIRQVYCGRTLHRYQYSPSVRTEIPWGGTDLALYDRQRRGHPAEISADAVAWVIGLACQPAAG